MSPELDEQALALQAELAGEYSLESEIGRGGMGIVYLARDVALDRPVAIKLLHESLASDPATRQRFLLEARTCARLVHPNIVPIFDVGERDSMAWIVMGHIDGDSLADRLERNGPMRPAEVAKVLRDLGWALGAAHGAGVIHRDITLSNVIVEHSTGRAMLLDFGLATEWQGHDGGSLVGTPEYLAPELLHGAAPTPQSDIYALGVIGWALLTGHLPISGETPADILLKRLQDGPGSLDQSAPGTPGRLRAAIESALADDPAARPARVEDWLASLDESADAVVPVEPLCNWVESSSLTRPFYALSFAVVGMVMFMEGGYLHILRLSALRTLPTIIPAMAVALLVGGLVHFTLAVSALRKAARSGYVLTDLQVSLGDAIRRRVAVGSRPAPLLGRVMNDLAWLSIIGLVVEHLVSILLPWPVILDLSPGAFSLLLTFAYYTPWLLLVAFVGIGFGFILPPREEKPRGLNWRIREMFWNSWLGKLAFRIGTIGIRSPSVAPNTLHRPTEVMLQVGIADLYEALPEPQRRGLEGLPEVATRLQRKVGKVRERIALLEGPAGTRSAEAAATRERLVELRDEAISVLERLRRDLLHLGARIATTGPLSEQLRQLRTADQRLLNALRSIP